jgi:hypothetical protein
MNTKQLNDYCQKLLAHMANSPDDMIHIEDAEQLFGSSRGDWLTVFEHLIREKIAEPSTKSSAAVIELTPFGVDIASQTGGYIAFVGQRLQREREEQQRTRQTATDSRLSARVAVLSVIVTIGIAGWQSCQNTDTTGKLLLLETRQKGLTDSLKKLYKLRVHPNDTSKNSVVQPAKHK